MLSQNLSLLDGMDSQMKLHRLELHLFNGWTVEEEDIEHRQIACEYLSRMMIAQEKAQKKEGKQAPKHPLR